MLSRFDPNSRRSIFLTFVLYGFFLVVLIFLTIAIVSGFQGYNISGVAILIAFSVIMIYGVIIAYIKNKYEIVAYANKRDYFLIIGFIIFLLIITLGRGFYYGDFDSLGEILFISSLFIVPTILVLIDYFVEYKWIGKSYTVKEKGNQKK